ncbi:MAG: glycosyltransferase [Saprospiraceae bacterium]|nr:glycosyltransferase [Saprospiraceae bacterium]
MNNFPKISIITPSFNQANYLEETILSILNQDYPNLEYIIIDGGSTDDSVAIIKKYEKKLAYWTSEPDNGLYHALQKGFEKATGEIMAWLNSDDLYHNRSLFVVAEIFTQFSQIQWLTGIPTYFNNDGQIVRVGYQAENWSLFRFLLRGRYFRYIQQESTFWRRSLWLRSGGFVSQEYNLAGDFELWRRFFRCEKLYTVHTILAGFRFRMNNQKSLEQKKGYDNEIEKIIKYDPLSRKQKLHLILCILYQNSILRFIRDGGIVRKLTKYLFNYPPVLFYDRFTNRFEWTDNL